MSRKLHLTISKEPGGLPTRCSFPLKLMIVWMTTSALFSLEIKLPELLLRAPPRGLLGLLCPVSWPPANSSGTGVSGSFHFAGGLVWSGLVPEPALGQGYGVGDRKVHGKGTWGSGDRHIRSDFQFCYVPFSDSCLGLSLPVPTLYHFSSWHPGWACGASAPQGTLCADLGQWEIKDEFGLSSQCRPLCGREISTSVNNSVLQRTDCLYCIICEKFLPQNLICGSINLKNSSECSICLLNKEQVIAEDSHPYHFVLLSSLWEEHKGPRSLFLTLSLAKVWKACFHSISLQK